MTNLLPALQALKTAGSRDERDAAFDDFPEITYDDSDPSNPKVIVTDRRDLSIPIGTWTLRLVPYEEQTGGTRLEIQLTLDATDDITALRVELARFELIADTDHLVAADMHTRPYTHLTPTVSASGDPIPVRLHGPALELTMSGPGLSDVSLQVLGAVGSTDPAFPSLRFDPPHFLVGDGFIGVVCDEATLDLSTAANPQIVDDRVTTDPTWRGLHLKDLGVFVNSEGAPDTWSGMAAMHDFFIGFDAVDLTGTFSAELVHHAVDTPQVVVRIWEMLDNGNVDLVATTSDVLLDAPSSTKRPYRRVRLVARPSWDDETGTRAAGVRVRWDVPTGVEVEEPLRGTQMDLGWVRVPPGVFDFSVEVSDHRIATITAQRTITVAAPDSPTATALRAVLEAGVIDPAAVATTPPTRRLHLSIPTVTPAREIRVVARARGGTGPATAVLNVPGGFSITSGAVSQTIAHDPTTGSYDIATWMVSAPPTMPPAGDEGAFELVVIDDDDTTVHRRLRYTLVDPADGQAPDFLVVPYADWRDDPGTAIARVELLGGLAFRDISWALESVAVEDSLFTDASDDALFEAAAVLPMGESPDLALSAGTVRPHLHAPSRLWRLTGTVGASAAPATPAPIVVGERAGSTRLRGGEVALLAMGVQPDVHDTRPVMFAYDSAGIQELDAPPHNRPGPEASPRSYADTMTEQAQGLRVLLEALHHYGQDVQELGLYGAASAEGSLAYNHDLGRRRASATRTVLEKLIDETAEQKVEDGLSSAGWSRPPDLAARIGHLVEHISTGSVGEFGARSTAQGIDPDDRRVFAVLLLKTKVPVQRSRRVYFATLPGAPPPAAVPAVPHRELQEHPFHHAIFRQAHVEIELLRNRLVRAQIRLTLDLERFNENDDLDSTELNIHDGITTFFLEYKELQTPSGRRWMWDAAVLADPRDLDGLALMQDPTVTNLVGGPAIVVPALTALAGGRIGLTAFLGAAAVGGILTATGVVDVDRLILNGVRARVGYGGGDATELRLGVDYTVLYDLDADLTDMGLPITLQTQEPIKVTFRNLGVVLRDWQHVEFDYDPADGFSLEIDDPGVFQLGEGIGRLLSVQSFRSGAGSPLWIEVELAIGLDTGIFRIDSVRIRLSVDTDKLFERDSSGRIRLGAGDLTLSDFELSLNKLGVSANVPGVLSGSGQAGIRQATLDPSGITGTEVSGDVDLRIDPLELRLYAGLKVFHSPALTAVYGYLGAEFAPGIPLGNTGVALYGLEGLVGVNMARSEPDPRKVLEWYTANPRGVTHTDKWTPRPGAWAFGVGAVLGTAVDTGFTWSTKGGLVIQAPGPQILLATYSRFVSPKPDLLPVPAEAGLATVVLLDFDSGVFLAAALFELAAEPLLTLRVPAEIFFNLRSAPDWHLRLGQWTPQHKRVSAKVLGMFHAWTYFQFEGNGYTGPGITLTGLSVAHGAGTSVVWGSRSARVYAEGSIEYHLGVQLRPIYLEGNLHAQGQLHLGPISLGVTFALEAKAPNPFVIRGEACAEVKVWFVRIKGCVGFTIGSGTAVTPAPSTPLTGVVAVDRMTSTALDPGDRVPLDAALHLTFDQVVRDTRPAGKALDLGSSTVWRNQVSTDLYYEYDITTLTITPQGGSPLSPFQSAWAQPSLEDASAADADGPRALRLLDWLPNAHTRALDFEAGYGRTISELIQRLCDAPPPATRGCATFDEQPLGPGSSWRLDDGDLAPVTVIAGTGDVLAGQTAGAAMGVVTATVVARPSVTYDGLVARVRALRLPSAGSRGPDRGEVLPGVPTEEIPDEMPERDVEERTADEEREEKRRKLEERDAPVEQLTEATYGSEPEHRAVVGGRREPLWEQILAMGERRRHHEPPMVATHVPPAVRQPLHFLPFAGLVFIRLPDLVDVEAIVLVHDRATDGGAVFLDEDFAPLGPSQPLASAPIVPGSAGTGSFHAHRARAVRLGPPAPGEAAPARAAWLVLTGVPPVEPDPHRKEHDASDPHTYLTQICGTTFGEWDRARQAATEKATAIQTITDLSGIVAGVPATSSAPLLAKDTTYQLNATIQWRRYRSRTSAATDGTGTFSVNHSFKTVAAPPTDIDRYIDEIDPTGLDQPHYCAEPVAIRFAVDVVDRIFAAFGQQLVARLKPDVGGAALNEPLRDGTVREFVALDSFSTTIAEAIADSPCIGASGEQLFPTEVYRTSRPLEPNTGYTLSLIPRPVSEPPPPGLASAPPHLDAEQYWDTLLQADFDAGKAVLRADLLSSRWMTFADHVAAFRAAPPLDVIGSTPAELATAVAAVAGSFRADASVDTVNGALFGGPLPIPSTCQTVRLWTLSGTPAAPFDPPPLAFAGLLLDGPEPLLRLRPDGSASSRAEVLVEGTPLSGVTEIVATAGARAFLLFTPPPGTTELTVRLSYERHPTDTRETHDLAVTIPDYPGPAD